MFSMLLTSLECEYGGSGTSNKGAPFKPSLSPSAESTAEGTPPTVLCTLIDNKNQRFAKCGADCMDTKLQQQPKQRQQKHHRKYGHLHTSSLPDLLSESEETVEDDDFSFEDIVWDRLENSNNNNDFVDLQDQVRKLQLNMKPTKSCLKTQQAQKLSSSVGQKKAVTFPSNKSELVTIMKYIPIHYEMPMDEITNTWYKLHNVEYFRSDGKNIATELRLTACRGYNNSVANAVYKPIDNGYNNIIHLAKRITVSKNNASDDSDVSVAECDLDTKLHRLLVSLGNDDDEDNRTDNKSTFYKIKKKIKQPNFHPLHASAEDIMNQNMAYMYLEGFKVWTTYSTTTSSSPQSLLTPSNHLTKINIINNNIFAASCPRGLEHWTSKRYHTCRREVMMEARKIVVDMSKSKRHTAEEISHQYIECTKPCRILARLFGLADQFAVYTIMQQEDISCTAATEQEHDMKAIKQQQQHPATRSADTTITSIEPVIFSSCRNESHHHNIKTVKNKGIIPPSSPRPSSVTRTNVYSSTFLTI